MNSDSTDHTSGETPHELDEFMVRRVRSALADVDTPDPEQRSQHIAAALAAFDDVLDEARHDTDDATSTVTAIRPRIARRRAWLPAASAAAVVAVVIGTIVATSTDGSDHNESVASQAVDSENDSSMLTDDAGTDDAASTMSESAEPTQDATSLEAQPPRDSSIAAEASDSLNDLTDLGVFDTVDALRSTLDSHLNEPSSTDGATYSTAPQEPIGGSSIPESIDPSSGVAAPSIADSSRSSTDQNTCGIDGAQYRRFVAQVGSVHYVIGVSTLTGEVIARDSSSCAEVPL